jgi:hypothetical protein
MKNIHVLPTNNSSRLCKDELGTFHITESMISKVSFFKNQNIYITSDEDIMIGDFYIAGVDIIYQCLSSIELEDLSINSYCKKIILTTDVDLIKEGVQTIDDEFLEWFVKNPSCKEVEVGYVVTTDEEIREGYWVSIPDNQFEMQQEEPKQETLEEIAENYSQKYSQKVGRKYGFMDGAKWQAERMYSEVEVIQILINYLHYLTTNDGRPSEEWFEQFKKK